MFQSPVTGGTCRTDLAQYARHSLDMAGFLMILREYVQPLPADAAGGDDPTSALRAMVGYIKTAKSLAGLPDPPSR